MAESPAEPVGSEAPEPAPAEQVASEGAAAQPAAPEPPAAAAGSDAQDAAPAPGPAATPEPAAAAAPAPESTPEPAPAQRRTVLGAPSAATGRRKEAVARVRIVPGSGQWDINGRSLDTYFPNKMHQQVVNEPFRSLDLVDRYDVIARVHGGGVSGQAGALRLGIARALIESDAESRPVLKKGGLLTRDARVKERRKYGLKKARKAPQYSKR